MRTEAVRIDRYHDANNAIRGDQLMRKDRTVASIVLVHGAWLGGWIWRDVAGRLREAGHDVYTPTLTGLGERVHLAQADTDLQTHVTDIVNVMAYEDLDDVVLVGHSYAASVVQSVADRVPERLAALVYLDSAPLGNGMALLDLFSPDGRAETEAVVAEFGDGWKLPYPGTDGLAEQASIAGLEDGALALMAERATAQPFETFRQPLSLDREFAGEYRRSLIACSEGDFSVEAIKNGIASGQPWFQPLAAPDWTFHDIPTGHWPMLSTPSELALVLAEIAERG